MKYVLIFLAMVAISTAMQSYTLNRQTHFLVKTSQGMMDIAAKDAVQAQSIADGLVSSMAAEVVNADKAELQRAAELVATSDLSVVTKATLEAIKVKTDAELIKVVEPIDVQK